MYKVCYIYIYSFIYPGDMSVFYPRIVYAYKDNMYHRTPGVSIQLPLKWGYYRRLGYQ